MIFVLHTLLVAYLILLPFVSSSPQLLFLHVALLLSITFHWNLNNDVCALTLLEQRMNPEVPKDQLFMQRLVGPFYNVSDRDIRCATYLLMLITIVKFFTIKNNNFFF